MIVTVLLHRWSSIRLMPRAAHGQREQRADASRDDEDQHVTDHGVVPGFGRTGMTCAHRPACA